MLVAGIVCIVLAAIAAGVAWWSHRKHKELAAVETSTCGDMRQLADAVIETTGAGVFRERCELVGSAKPAQIGTVEAPMTKRECLWYRSTVTEEYWDWEWRERNGERVRDRVRKTRVLSDQSSDIPFAVDDGTGQAVIHTAGLTVDQPVEVLDRMDPDTKTDGLIDFLGDALLGVSEDTIGYRREEWIIPVDARLFVQGEVTDEQGTLMLRKPEKGTFRVSTRSEEELLKGARSGRRWGSVAAVVFGVAGIALAVAGAVTG
jgi:hypothetical protein